MANFRCERVVVKLEQPVPGLNHLRAVNSEAFADALTEELDNALSDDGVETLTAFLYAPFDRPKWHPAAASLEAIRAALAILERWHAAESVPVARTKTALAEDISALRQVAEVLDAADTRDRRFHFLAQDSD